MNAVLEEALKLYQAGYNVLPQALDGQKRPDPRWLPSWVSYRSQRITESELHRWFINPQGLGIVGGWISGFAELLDFDNHGGQGCVFRTWTELIPRDLFRKLVLYQTPHKGWRACWRCPEANWRGTRDVVAKSDPKNTLIELLGNWNILVPGGDVRCHETCLPYTYVRGHLAGIPTITTGEREHLLTAARSFNRVPERTKIAVKHYEPRDPKANWWASDDYNLRAQWEDILEPLGWTVVGGSGDKVYWRRPDKTSGVSATTNHYGNDLLYIFTSSTELDANRFYSKFAIYALFYHGGNFSKAAKELARLGYGRANQDLSISEQKIKELYD